MTVRELSSFYELTENERKPSGVFGHSHQISVQNYEYIFNVARTIVRGIHIVRKIQFYIITAPFLRQRLIFIFMTS